MNVFMSKMTQATWVDVARSLTSGCRPAGHKTGKCQVHRAEAVQRNTTCEVWYRWHRAHLRNCLLQRPRVAREIASVSRIFASGCSCRSHAGVAQALHRLTCRYVVNSASIRSIIATVLFAVHQSTGKRVETVRSSSRQHQILNADKQGQQHHGAVLPVRAKHSTAAKRAAVRIMMPTSRLAAGQVCVWL